MTVQEILGDLTRANVREMAQWILGAAINAAGEKGFALQIGETELSLDDLDSIQLVPLERAADAVAVAEAPPKPEAKKPRPKPKAATAPAAVMGGG